jgi:hypothetical protein
MPVDPDLPRSERATLAQAVRWVAFRLVPRPERFERLEDYPRRIGEFFDSSPGVDGEAYEMHGANDKKCRNAKRAITKQLQLGRLHADGYMGLTILGEKLVSRRSIPKDYNQKFELPDWYLAVSIRLSVAGYLRGFGIQTVFIGIQASSGIGTTDSCATAARS